MPKYNIITITEYCYNRLAILTPGAVFIDFRKAFDSIDHHLLLNKLSALGIENQEYA